ncbi:MAG: FAD-binding oxidoreductase [Solirubrobacterales bacterium]
MATSTPLDQAAGSRLASEFGGQLISPADGGYDEARKVYNGMIDRRPGLIARCADGGDVAAAVDFARREGVLVSIRGGGHNAGGLGVCDDGLVIDLSPMRDIEVDPGAKTVRVQGGATWGEVDRATHAHGLAVPSGIISTTGVGGLTLGGGIGHLSRKHGLTIDSLLSVDMVLADGTSVTASEDQNEDLFWAVRGGGGNFGAVTSFQFRGNPVHTVLAGPMFWPLEQTEEALRFYDEFIAGAPEDVNGFFAFLTVPPADPFPAELHMRKVCGVVWCCTGDLEEAEQAMRPAREFGPPLLDGVQPMPFPDIQSAFDELYPSGLQWYWKADFVDELPDEAVAAHAEHGAQLPSMHSTMHLYPIDGAVHRVGSDETAFAYRDSRWAEVIVGVDPDPANAAAITDWTRRYWEALHPHSAGGAYVNFLMHDEGGERVKATYRGNYDRLVEVKRRYDPDNLFRVNQNIAP